MRVIFPWARWNDHVIEALRQATDYAWAFHVGYDDTAYFRLLSNMWHQGETFVVVEHDVLVKPWSIDDLERCSHPWCAWQIKYGAGFTPGLGCAKFTAEVMSQVPDAMERVGRCSDAGHPPMHWCRIDWWLQHKILPGAGLVQHVHGGPLDHLRDTVGDVKPSHDCQSPGQTVGKRAARLCLRAS